MQENQTLHGIYQKTILKFSAFGSSWAGFLKFAARFYPCDFENMVLIYGQNPHATMLATESQWKEMGRLVKENEKGVFVFSNRPDKVEAAYLFDVSQTYGKKPNSCWRICEAEKEECLSNINRLRLEPAESVSQYYLSVVQKNIQRYGPFSKEFFLNELKSKKINPVEIEKMEKRYILLLKRSVQYIVGVRCGFHSHQVPARSSFSSIKEFHSTFSATRIGRTSINMARPILAMAENMVRRISREEKYWYESDLYEAGQFTLSEYSNIQQPGGRPAAGQTGAIDFPKTESGASEPLFGLTGGRRVDGRAPQGGGGSQRPIFSNDRVALPGTEAAGGQKGQGESAEEDSHSCGGNRGAGGIGQPEIKSAEQAKEPPIGGSFFEP